VEREVRDRFPAFRVGRLDRDVVERRGAAERVLDAFEHRAIDVLVGTSLVAKGLDVPNVTLVGVVSADVALNLPDERAAERTYQLLAQAAGRGGRRGPPGPVAATGPAGRSSSRTSRITPRSAPWPRTTPRRSTMPSSNSDAGLDRRRSVGS
jgi:primosomal protein N'